MAHNTNLQGTPHLPGAVVPVPVPPLVPIAVPAAPGQVQHALEVPPAPLQPATGRGSRKQKYDADNAAKQEVEDKLRSGVYDVILIDEDNPLQSPAWKKFARIIDTENNKQLNYVRCRNIRCGLIKMLTGGRGNLASHVCKEKPTPVPTTPPKSVIKDFRANICQMHVGKLIPIRTVESPEFRSVIEAAIKIGSEYGPVNVDEILPSAKTLTTEIGNLANKARAHLIEKIKPDVEDGLASATVDNWVDLHHKRKFLTQTLSIIPEDFEMEDHVLFTSHCDAESVDAPVLREEIDVNLERLTLPSNGRLHYVCDDGADIVAALKDQERSYCMDHATDLCVKKSLQPQLTKIDLYGKEGGLIVDNVGKAVNIIKSSRKRSLKFVALKKSLLKGPVTHRNSQRVFKSSVPMLQSTVNRFSQVSFS